MLTGPSAVDLLMSHSEERMLGKIILCMFNDKIFTELCCFCNIEVPCVCSVGLSVTLFGLVFPNVEFISANVKSLLKSL